MPMIHSYEELCSIHGPGEVRPDITSYDGRRSLEFLRKNGWDIGRENPVDDLLTLCRQSKSNFEFAYTDAGIDFWVRE